MSIFRKGALALGLLASVGGALHAQDSWKLAKDESGVKVYTRKVSGWSLLEFKAVVVAKASLAETEALLRNAEGRKNWMYNTLNTKDIKKVSNNEIYTYSVVDAPWPVDDRDNVTRLQYKRPSENEILVEMSAAPEAHPEVKNVVRIKKLKGFWKFVDKGNGTVEITQQCLSEAGGNIPGWLANSSVVDSPFHTLLNMKKLLEK